MATNYRFYTYAIAQTEEGAVVEVAYRHTARASVSYARVRVTETGASLETFGRVPRTANGILCKSEVERAHELMRAAVAHYRKWLATGVDFYDYGANFSDYGVMS